MKKILVLCTGNSCRSQMAHGYLEQVLSDQADVFSAGVEAHGLNPWAVRVMRQAGIDINHHTSNTIDDYAGHKFDFVITVCDHAREKCPVFPGNAVKLHRNFPDPASAKGSPAELEKIYRDIRDMISEFVDDFAAQHFESVTSPA